MEDNKSAVEHRRYSKRLEELEKRSAAARQHQKMKPKLASAHVGNQLRKIKFKRYRLNTSRVFKLVFLFLLILLLMIYIISPLSKIDKLRVVGNHDLTVKQVEKTTKVYPGRFIWGVWLTQKTIEKQAIADNAQVKSLKIKVLGPQTVQLSLRENSLIGTAVLNNDTYAILADGQLKRTDQVDNGITYKRFDGHQKALEKTAVQIGKLKPAIRNGISSVNYRPTKHFPNRLIIYMRDGNTVYADLTTVGKKLAYYPGIAASMKDKGIIDLQVGAYSYSYKSDDK